MKTISFFVIFLMLGCQNISKQKPVAVPPVIKSREIIKSFMGFSNPQVIISPASINPSISMDNNGNLTYSNIFSTNYYILQSSVDLNNWTNISIFYNKTNYQVNLNKDKEFFRLRVIYATSATIMWDLIPSTNSISSINIYYGHASHSYDSLITINNDTNAYTITNLTPNAEYFIALTAIDSSNIESDYSSELKFDTNSILNNN